MNHKDKIILEILEKYNEKEREIKVLDIGAGDNPYWKKIPENVKYTSIDIDPKRKPDIVCDIEKKFPIKDKIYDFVICSEVLEHTFYPRKIIKEIKRVTKDDGFIIITMPNEYNLYLRLKFLSGIQNNTEVPFRDKLWKNHIHKARVKDLIKFYKEEFNVKEITYSWDSFSNKKINNIFLDKVIHNFFLPLSKNLFSRSVIMIGKND